MGFFSLAVPKVVHYFFKCLPCCTSDQAMLAISAVVGKREKKLIRPPLSSSLGLGFISCFLGERMMGVSLLFSLSRESRKVVGKFSINYLTVYPPSS